MNTDWLDAIHDHLEWQKKMKVWDNPMRQVIGDRVVAEQRAKTAEGSATVDREAELQAAIDEFVAANACVRRPVEAYTVEQIQRKFAAWETIRRLASK